MRFVCLAKVFNGDVDARLDLKRKKLRVRIGDAEFPICEPVMGHKAL